MKSVSISVILALLAYAASAIQNTAAVSLDGDDRLVEEEEEADEEANGLEGDGPLLDRIKGLVSRSRNASQQKAQEAKAKVAILAKEASAKAEAEFRKLFRKTADARNATAAASQQSTALLRGHVAENRSRLKVVHGGASALRGNATAVRGNVTHRRHNSTARHNTTVAARAATAARKAAAVAKYVTAPELSEKAKERMSEPGVEQPKLHRATRAAAVGDPHMTNIKGQRFDVAQPGVHTLVLIPRFARLPSNTLLHVEADVRHIGTSCEDIYIQQLNVTGMWVTNARDGMRFHAGHKSASFAQWWHLGSVQLKVVDGRTKGGIEYLNFFIRGLGHAGLSIGGILGDDDHTLAATKTVGCGRTIALLADSMAEERPSNALRSHAEASL